MLYLGKYDGKNYIFHDLWAYRHKSGDDEIIYRVGKAVITDLDVGKGSSKGSFLERLTRVTEISLH
jgi:hypothetical protein